MKTYSLKKGLLKGVVSGLIGLGVIVTFAGFSDVSIWTLLEQYLKPVIGAMTVGGAISMAVNFVKVKMA